MTNRVDAAKKLRGSEDRLYGSSFYGGALKAVDVIREYIDAAYDYEDFFNRLSKLIDPTCYNFGGEEGTNGENYEFACSACGWCGDVTEPKYCPNCGSRVVTSNAGEDDDNEQ